MQPHIEVEVLSHRNKIEVKYTNPKISPKRFRFKPPHVYLTLCDTVVEKGHLVDVIGKY